MADKVLYDIDGQEVVTNALLDLLNDCPALNGIEVKYSTLGSTSGMAMFPTSGSAIAREDVNILGRVKQICEYPFILVFRASGLTQSRKVNAKELLDNIGKWLEKQPIVVGTQEYKLESYPDLSRGRKFDEIRRSSVSYLDSENESKAENWVINITATYINEFER
ncbi:MAG: hypothetical protein KBT34_09895 [Prevotella sp.]|nr:hypothetical protein [Candidatus Prevotella equi]